MYTWNILDDMFSMRDLIERTFSELNTGNQSGYPAVNIYETETASEVQALVPGLEKTDLDISFENGMLTIASLDSEKSAEKNVSRVVREECRRPRFRRSLRFGHTIDRDAISARLADGVLTIVLPKKAEVQPKRIEVG